MNDCLGLINWLSKCHWLQWLADWWIDFLAERLTDWVTCWLNDQNNDLFTCCMTDLLAYLLTDQLTELFTNSYWSIDWLTGSLADLPTTCWPSNWWDKQKNNWKKNACLIRQQYYITHFFTRWLSTCWPTIDEITPCWPGEWLDM